MDNDERKNELLQIGLLAVVEDKLSKHSNFNIDVDSFFSVLAYLTFYRNKTIEILNYS